MFALLQLLLLLLLVVVVVVLVLVLLLVLLLLLLLLTACGPQLLVLSRSYSTLVFYRESQISWSKAFFPVSCELGVGQVHIRIT